MFEPFPGIIRFTKPVPQELRDRIAKEYKEAYKDEIFWDDDRSIRFYFHIIPLLEGEKAPDYLEPMMIGDHLSRYPELPSIEPMNPWD